MTENLSELRVLPDSGKTAEQLADNLDRAAADRSGALLNVSSDTAALGWQELTQIRRVNPEAEGYLRRWTCVCMGRRMSVSFEGDSLRLRPFGEADQAPAASPGGPRHAGIPRPPAPEPDAQVLRQQSRTAVRFWGAIIVTGVLAMGITVTAPGEYSVSSALFFLVAGAVMRLAHALSASMLEDRPGQLRFGNWLIFASWGAIVLALL